MRSTAALLVTAVVTAVLTACSSQIPSLKDWADAVVGKNVSVLRELAKPKESYSSRVGWQETTYTLPNGNWVYVQPDRPHCEIHFEVNGQNLIVGYTPVGAGCRYQ